MTNGRNTFYVYNVGDQPSQIAFQPTADFTGGISNVVITPMKSTNSSVDLYDDDAFNLTFQISEDITARSTTFSKTINLPGTQNNNKIFGNILDEHVWVDLETQDSVFLNKKLTAAIYQDSLEVIYGYFELEKVNKLKNGSIEYEGVFYSNNKNLADTIGDKVIYGNEKGEDDLDFSEHDAVYSFPNMVASWRTGSTSYTTATGLYYPLIDFQAKDDTNIFPIQNIRPALYVKELFDKIVKKAGFNYTSTFLNSETFKSLIVPMTQDYDEPMFNQDRLVFRVGMDKNFSGTTQGPPQSYVKFASSITDPDNAWVSSSIPFNTTGNTTSTVTEMFDPGGQVNKTTYHWVVTQAGNYNVSFTAKYSLWMEAYNANGAVSGGWYLFPDSNPAQVRATIKLKKKFDGTTVNVKQVTNDHFVYGNRANGWAGFTEQQHAVNYNGIVLEIGDELWCEFALAAHNCTCYNTLGQKIGFLVERCLIFKDSTYFYNTYNKSSNLYEGNTIRVNGLLPKMKQIEFIKNVSDMFNLIYMEDKTNPNTLIIEPYDTFYQDNTYIDWNQKVDASKPMTIERIPYLIDKDAIFTNSKDSNDTLTTTYFDNYNAEFGSKSVKNPYMTLDNFTIKTDFSSTMLDEFGNTNWIMSKMYNLKDRDQAIKDNKLTETRFNYRILYRKTLYANRDIPRTVNLSMVVVQYSHGVSDLKEWNGNQVFPYAGHLDNPYNPVNDYNFGMANYYIHNGATRSGSSMTYQNIYWNYWKNRINLYMDPNSKKVVYWMRLTPADIANFDFRKKIMINNALYIISKIVEWNPTTSCKVELIKLTNYINPDTNLSPEWKTSMLTKSGASKIVKVTKVYNIPAGVALDNMIYSSGYTGSTIQLQNNYPDGSAGLIMGYGNNVYNGSDFFITGNNNDVDGDGNTILHSNSNIITANNSMLMASSNNNVLAQSIVIGSNNNTIQANEPTMDGLSGQTVQNNIPVLFNSSYNTFSGNTNLVMMNSSGITIGTGVTNAIVIGVANKTITENNKTYIGNAILEIASPNGTKYLVTVSNTGVLQTQALPD